MTGDAKQWRDFTFIHESLLSQLEAVYSRGATEVQTELLSKLQSCKTEAQRSQCCFIVASKTGTGKTMAFSIPLLNRIILTNQEEGPPAKKPCKTPLEISNQSSLKDEEGFIDLNTLMGDHLSTQKYLKIQALIISPSRELCIQIKKHIESVVSNQNITVLSLTGGLNHAKQHNLLEKEPNIVVGTPGRILDFTNLDPRFANSLKHLQTLVFDEADKLFDPKSFSEIKSILNLLRCKKSDEDSGYVQIYMVSATLYSIYGTQDANTQKYLKHFMKKLKLNHNKIHHINLIDDCALPSKLEEFKIFCLNPDKDLYLLYLLQKLESKFCMIFVNSKDKVKILTEKLELCGYKNRVFGLSSELNQRQRFESLKRFSDLDDSKKDVPKILITTDLSSRGFDIESISCIIHYDVPNAHGTYIHRCGRTARNDTTGSSYLLLEAKDFMKFKDLSTLIGSNSKKYIVHNSSINCFKEQSKTIDNYLGLKRFKSKIEDQILKAKLCQNEFEHNELKKKLNSINTDIRDAAITIGSL